MDYWLPAIFALLVAAAGWFYMFYSRAAANLKSLEQSELNALRQRLRRTNGLLIFLLAVCFVVLNYTLSGSNVRGFAIVMLLVLLLLVGILSLAWVDLRLTWRIKGSWRKRSDEE
jgi:UDP-N-acetylmuramyl pentapeptide phosphotransferase/UDP-N-acetylglucosamine-1-phosphate transferase